MGYVFPDPEDGAAGENVQVRLFGAWGHWLAERSHLGAFPEAIGEVCRPRVHGTLSACGVQHRKGFLF